MTDITQGRVIDIVRDFGKPISGVVAASRLLPTAAQRKHICAHNFMTPAAWAYRSLAGGQLVVEVSYGTFMDNPLLGVSVYHTDAAKADRDFDVSRVVHSVEELRDLLTELDATKEVVA